MSKPRGKSFPVFEAAAPDPWPIGTATTPRGALSVLRGYYRRVEFGPIDVRAARLGTYRRQGEMAHGWFPVFEGGKT